MENEGILLDLMRVTHRKILEDCNILFVTKRGLICSRMDASQVKEEVFALAVP